jgi:tripeptidyl-peptidase II
MQTDKTIRFFVLLLAAGLLVFSTAAAEGEKGGFSYLSLEATGVDDFLKAHPGYDGRGVVVFVLDNGGDPGVPGLVTTSTGERKFLDARDFTGEGDVLLEAVEVNGEGELMSEDGEMRLIGLDSLKVGAEDGEYWLGVLKEERFLNTEFADTTGTTDINDNGKEDDAFAVVAFEVEGAGYWVALVDTDADGSVDDEEVHRSFCEDRKFLYFQRRLPEKQTQPMTFALTIDPEEEIVSFHYPDGDHSTHVSGITAGFGIDGQEGFNGVAPGANLVSCKIGDGTLSGGATVTASMKDACEFVREYAEEQDDEVVIVNMSYGIGSEVEGTSDIDRYIDALLCDNPNIVLCTSAGNEGPGLSTVGTPAASYMAISVGAVMAKDVARDAYAAELDGHRLLHFSSRGGELDKPDICAPGACLSTVPRWSRGSRMWGTSMASPYMAGVMALLVSAAREEFPDRKVNSGMLLRAVQNSADPIEGCTGLGSGAGMVNVPRAWDCLSKALSAEPCPVLAWKISTLSPIAPGGRGRAAYWRSVYFPGGEKQTFRVSPVFLPDTPAETISGFFRSLNLDSDAPFLRAVQDSFPLRQDVAGTVSVLYDADKLTEPGVYCGRVTAYRGAKIPANREFDLLNTVIVPYTFDSRNDYVLDKKNVASDPLEPVHYFLAVPPGGSAMDIAVTVPEGKFSSSRMELFDPAGRSFDYLTPLNSARNALESFAHVTARDLEPGVWELVVWGDYRAGKTSWHNLRVEFMGFHVQGEPKLKLDYKPGSTPRGSFAVINLYDKAVWATGSGQVWGYRRTREEHVEESDEYSYTFSLDESLQGVQFAVEMTPETYGYFTDFAINILDGEGVSLLKEGLSYRKSEFFFPNPGGKGTYTLEMIAGFTHASLRPFDFTLTEKFLRAEPIPVHVSYRNGDAVVPFIPGIATGVRYKLEGVPPVAPKGFDTAATLIFKERGTGREVLRVRFDTSGK